MRYVRLSLVLLVLLVLLVPVVASPLWAKGGWEFITPMPHGRGAHDAVLGKDGKIYVMGGIVLEATKERNLRKFNDGRYSNLVYDRPKDTWRYLEPVLGGYDRSRWMTHDGEKGNEWVYHQYQQGMTIPENVRKTNLVRQGSGVRIVCAPSGKIYWVGGRGGWTGHGEATVIDYDPQRDAWPDVSWKRTGPGPNDTRNIYHYELPSMHELRIDHEAVITSDGKIYVMGGWHVEEKQIPQAQGGYRMEFPGVVTDTMECYDPGIGKWEYKKPLKSKRTVFAAVVGRDDKIYVFGGAAGMYDEPTTPILDTVEVYDPKTESWSDRRPMPEPKAWHAAALGADGKIYVLGGASALKDPLKKDVFIYDPATDSWEKGPSMKVARAHAAAVATADGKIYAIGGTDVGGHGGSETLNTFLPKGSELSTGKVQETVEVLDISK